MDLRPGLRPRLSKEPAPVEMTKAKKVNLAIHTKARMFCFALNMTALKQKNPKYGIIGKVASSQPFWLLLHTANFSFGSPHLHSKRAIVKPASLASTLDSRRSHEWGSGLLITFESPLETTPKGPGNRLAKACVAPYRLEQ